MHEVCPVQEEVIYYTNDNFQPENTVVGWAGVGGNSPRPVTRPVVGRVADSVVLFADGSEKIKVRTYVRSYKGDYPLSLLGGKISRSWESETHEETELTELYSREYASTFAYSHFAADPEILFPGVELSLIGPKESILHAPTVPEPVPVFAKAA